VIDTGTATTVKEEWPHAVIQVDPVHVVVTETYADSEVDVVCATLDDAVSVTMREGSGAVVQVATDGVVMIATGDVVLLALGVGLSRSALVQGQVPQSMSLRGELLVNGIRVGRSFPLGWPSVHERRALS
jgi:hypothetical protein